MVGIPDNESLFSLLGTTYGGDGVTNFGLPDLRSRIPIHAGSGLGLTKRITGYHLGQETVALAENMLPTHNHNLQVTYETATAQSPEAALLATTEKPFYSSSEQNVSLADASIQPSGGSDSPNPHYNMQPYLPVSFIIAFKGVYPSRN